MDVAVQLTRTLAGRYVIEREIGAGGMATVYLARDERHDRRVALKVLSSELGAVLGVERFLSEIRVTANLQHPNRLPLFDSGDADGLLFYVMPFVEGESLRAKLDREKQLPVDEAIHIAVAVGNALDYAHERGVIHRDLKPENILLQHGQPIIADFGIALAISNAGGGRITQTGLSLGTPQYMSPEQAAGDRTIDGRSDIYSLGAILYEMLAGEPPHVGHTVQAIIAKVLTDRPRPVRSARDTVPVHIELAVEKALAKLPADRFATASQLVRALEGDTTGLARPTVEPTPPSRRAWIRHPASIAVVAIAFGGVAVSGHLARRAPPAERTVRFTLAPPPGSRVREEFGHLVSISPDGRRIVYVGEGPRGPRLWIRDLADGTSRALPGTDNPGAPAFSPDGKTIVYMRTAALRYVRIPVDGGAAVPVFKANAGARFAWLGQDSTIHVPLANGNLVATAIGGGASVPFLRQKPSDTSAFQRDPYLAPDGKTLFFTFAPRPGDNLTVGVTTLASRTIEPTSIEARLVLGYTAGRLIYATKDGAIMAIAFDLRSRRKLGEPVSTGEVAQIDAYTVKASLSERGDLAYSTGDVTAHAVLVGRGAPPRLFFKDEGRFTNPRFSPDGSRIALTVTSESRVDVWILNVASGSLERLTTGGTDNERPEWSPDGRRVVFRSNQAGRLALWWQMADGSGSAERLTPPLNMDVHEGVFSPDGKTLLYRVDDTGDRARDIYAMSMVGDRTPRPFLTTEFDEFTPRFSPDGRWVVYVSNESGHSEVYVRPFPGPGGRMLVSTDGGVEPLWSRDGKRIFYRVGDAVLAASLSFVGAPSVSSRDTVVVGQFLTNRFHPAYDVAPDGVHLLMLEPSVKEVRPTIILNWAQELAKKLGPVK